MRPPASFRALASIASVASVLAAAFLAVALGAGCVASADSTSAEEPGNVDANAIRYNGISSALPPAFTPPPPAAGPTTTATPTEPSGCGAVPAEHGLAAGHSVASCDGRFSLTMQTDGNLVLDHVGAGPLWATHTEGSDGFAAVMQSDGNLVVYGAHSDALWNSKTGGHGGAWLALQDDGNLVVYGPGGSPLWASNTVVGTAPPAPPPGCTNLAPGQQLTPGQDLVSCDGHHRLSMQADGDLVVYHDGEGALWSTGTGGAGGHTAVMQIDGNLVLFDTTGHALWNSMTSGHAGAHLAMQDDGNLVLYASTGPALWASNTEGK